MREWCQEPQGVSACAHRTRVASYADEPVLKYKTSTDDPFAQSRSSRCSVIVVPKQKASDPVQHSAILGLCLLYMAERLANRISQFKEFFCCEVHGTAQLRDSCRSFGTFEARNPSPFQDLSFKLHSLSVHGSRGTPNKFKFKSKWPDASDFVSAFAQAYCGQAPRTARWATVQVTVSSASHLSVRLPVSDSCSSACT